MVKVERINSPESLQKAHAIRKQVFVIEQNCPPELEWEYEDESTHYLATWQNEPAGTCRYRITPNGYKLERFAVLPRYRGKGIAAALLQQLVKDIPAGSYMYMNAQVQAMPLYEKAGFKPVGPMFEEAGIQHYKMELTK